MLGHLGKFQDVCRAGPVPMTGTPVPLLASSCRCLIREGVGQQGGKSVVKKYGGIVHGIGSFQNSVILPL